MKWLKNLESIAKNHKSGLCPICGSKETDFGYSIIDPKSRMGYGAVWCNSCRHAFHISRVEVKDEKHIKEIPHNLIY